MKNPELLTQGAELLGIKLTSDQLDKFATYLNELHRWSAKINLTSIRDEKGIIINHFLDSLTIKKYIRTCSKILDIGTGAGFPGLPLGIVDETLDITVIDSVEKKIFFVSNVLRSIKLKNIKALKARADDKNNLLNKNSFDYVVTRAVSDITHCLSLSADYVSDNGHIILMRGKDGLEEWNNSDYVKAGGCILELSEKLLIPFSDTKRTILIIKKRNSC